jgi:hypothetical protein
MSGSSYIEIFHSRVHAVNSTEFPRRAFREKRNDDDDDAGEYNSGSRHNAPCAAELGYPEVPEKHHGSAATIPAIAAGVCRAFPEQRKDHQSSEAAPNPAQAKSTIEKMI